MNIGLFLDVDNTLTVDYIQKILALDLGVVKQYEEIESEFQVSKDANKFGSRLINLLNDAGFSEKYAKESYGLVNKSPWCADLLSLPVTKYLVSSGPNYYVERLGEEFEIPVENILCSKYTFTKDGKLDQCWGVTPPRKLEFVKSKEGLHDITIGLGDNVEHDSPFVGQCDISMLTVQSQGFLMATSLDDVINLVDNLSRKCGVSRTVPTVFIGSSSENVDKSDAVLVLLSNKQGVRPQVWRDGIFRPGKTNIENLEKALSDFDFAIFIMVPEDVKISRSESNLAVRDNIIFELGLFMGRLGRERCFLVYPNTEKPALPSDFDGISMLDYDADLAEDNPNAAFSACAVKIHREISRLRCRRLQT